MVGSYILHLGVHVVLLFWRCCTSYCNLSSSIIVTDTEPGDNPRPRSADFGMGSMAAAIGVIGGADGPTTLYMNNDKNARVACSALRFEKSSRPVKWHAEFLYKEYVDAEERLM